MWIPSGFGHTESVIRKVHLIKIFLLVLPRTSVLSLRVAILVVTLLFGVGMIASASSIPQRASDFRAANVSSLLWLAAFITAAVLLWGRPKWLGRFSFLAIIAALLADPIGFVVPGSLGLAAVGLWMLKQWGRQLTIFLLAFAVIVIPAGLLNPFHYMDYAATHGGQAPDTAMLLMWIVPVVAASLFCYGVIQKNTVEFVGR